MKDIEARSPSEAELLNSCIMEVNNDENQMAYRTPFRH
jgi:hypothetical protein